MCVVTKLCEEKRTWAPVLVMLFFAFMTVIHKHHVYKAIWTPYTGELLLVQKEPANTRDRMAATAPVRVICVAIVVLSMQMEVICNKYH